MVKKKFMKFLMHGNNKMQGICKEPMHLIMVQNSPLTMGDKIHKQPRFDEKVCDFVIKLSTNCNKV